MGVAETARRLPAREVVHRLVGEHATHAVEQCHVDVLPLARACAAGERRLDRDDAVEPGEEIGDGDTGLLRLAVRLAGELHDAAEALDHEVVAGLRRPGSVLPEARDRAVDEAGVRRAHALVIEPEAHEAADAEVLDHHVRAADQALDEGEIVRVGEVGDDRALAAVAGVEVGGGAVDEGGSPAARVVALRGLDLDDVGAEIGERLPDPGTGEDARELDDAQARQRRPAQKNACSPVCARPRISACTSWVPS